MPGTPGSVYSPVTRTSTLSKTIFNEDFIITQANHFYRYNGTDNYVSFPTPSYLPSADQSRSVTFTYSPAVIAGEKVVVGWGTDSNNAVFSITSLSAALRSLSVWAYNGATVYGSIPLQANHSYKVRVTYSTATNRIRMYINDCLDIDSTPGAFNTDASGFFRFMSDPVLGLNSGDLSDVRIFNKELSTTEGKSIDGIDASFVDTATLTTGNNPNFSIYAFGYIFVTNYSDGTVSKIDPVTKTVIGTSVGSGGQVSGLASDGTNIWVAVYGANIIRSLNPITLAWVDTISGFSSPVGVCYDGTNLWISDYGTGANRVRKVSPVSKTIIATVAVGSGPQAIYLINGFIYVLNYDGTTISKINYTTNTVVSTITGLNGPGQLTQLGNKWWVTNVLDGTVKSILISTETVTDTIYGFSIPWGIDNDGTYLWVAGTVTQLRVIDPSTLDVVGGTKSYATNSTAVLKVGSNVWVCTGTGIIAFNPFVVNAYPKSEVTSGLVFKALCNESSGACVDSVSANNGTVQGTTTNFYHPAIVEYKKTLKVSRAGG